METQWAGINLRGLAGFGWAERLNRIEVIKHHGSGHSAALPVVDPLLITRLPVKAEQARKGTIAASGFDDFSGLVLVHVRIKHHV